MRGPRRIRRAARSGAAGAGLSRGGGGHARTQKRPVGVGGAGARGPRDEAGVGERPGSWARRGLGRRRAERGSGGPRARSASLALRLSATFPAHPASPTRAHMTWPGRRGPEDPHPHSGLSPRWAGADPGSLWTRATRGRPWPLPPRVPTCFLGASPPGLPHGRSGARASSPERPPAPLSSPGQKRAEGRGLALSHPRSAPPTRLRRGETGPEGRMARRVWTDKGPSPGHSGAVVRGQGGDRPSGESRLASLLTGRRRRRPAVVCCSQREGPDLAWRAAGLAGSRGASCRRLPGALRPPSTPARAPARGAGRETAPGPPAHPAARFAPSCPPAGWTVLWRRRKNALPAWAAGLLAGNKGAQTRWRPSWPEALAVEGGGILPTAQQPSRLRPSSPSSVADT